MIPKELWMFLSIGIGLGNLVVYLVALFRKQIKPHLFTWLIWTLVQSIVAAAQFASGAGWGALPLAISACCCGLIVILSNKYGEKSRTKSDWIVLISALFAIPLWQLTNNPLWSVILLTFIDTIGYYPTIRKSRLNAWEESLPMFLISTLYFGCAVLALEEYSFTAALYPASMIVINGLFTLMLFIWRRQQPNLKPQ